MTEQSRKDITFLGFHIILKEWIEYRLKKIEYIYIYILMCCIHPNTKINFETDNFYFYKLYDPLPEVQDIYIGITTDTDKLIKYVTNCIWRSMVHRQVNSLI